MCVILQCSSEKPIPTIDMLREAEKTNPHGGGIAYNQDDGWTYVEKGMHITADYIHKLIKEKNLKKHDFIIHFRIATHGATNDNLCHPFLMHKNGNNPIKFRTRKSVLFHNGIWSDYDDFAIKLSFNRNINIPDGDISDSSIMAWIASNVGHNFLSMIDEKITVLSPEGIMRYGAGWVEVNNIMCSNDNFDSTDTWVGYGNYTVNKAKEVDAEVDTEQEKLPIGYSEYADQYEDELKGMRFYNQFEREYLDGEP